MSDGTAWHGTVGGLVDAPRQPASCPASIPGRRNPDTTPAGRGVRWRGRREEGLKRSDEVIAFALMTVGNDWRDNPSRLQHVLLQQLTFVWFHEWLRQSQWQMPAKLPFTEFTMPCVLLAVSTLPCNVSSMHCKDEKCTKYSKTLADILTCLIK